MILAGLAALAKVLIAMEDEAIPANLHFKKPNPDIPGLQDGRLKVIAERTPWNGGYVGINSFGFGGSNVHALLHSNKKQPAQKHPAANEQRLVTFSARTQEALEAPLKGVQGHGSNVELQALLQENAKAMPGTHPYRGYALVNNKNKVIEVQVGTQSKGFT